jgi:hypothetical protein
MLQRFLSPDFWKAQWDAIWNTPWPFLCACIITIALLGLSSLADRLFPRVGGVTSTSISRASTPPPSVSGEESMLKRPTSLASLRWPSHNLAQKVDGVLTAKYGMSAGATFNTDER